VAEQVPAVGNVLTTIERRDWSSLRRLLDPDVHWTTALEEHLHGPEQVVARLSADPPPHLGTHPILTHFRCGQCRMGRVITRCATG